MKSTSYPNKSTKQIDYKAIIYWITIILLITIFSYTALNKILHHDTFVWQLKKQPLPYWSKPVLAYLLPLVETTIVSLLLIQKTRKLGLILATTMLWSYSIYVFLAYMEVYGYTICACGKVFQMMGWKGHFYFNSSISILATSALYINQKKDNE